MKLNTKVLAVVLISWGLMLLATYWGSQKILVSSYMQLEKNEAYENLNRVNRAIDSHLAVLYYLLLTYAVWDDSYKFIVDKNQSYITGNLTANALITAKIEMELWFDPNGKLFYDVALNQDKTKAIPVPQNLVNAFKPNGDLNKMLYQPSLTSGTKGLAAIPEGLLFVVAHSITTSTGTSPPHGTLVMAKFFTDEILQQIREATKLDIKIFRLPLTETEVDLKHAYENLSKTNTPYIITDKSIIYTYEFLRDINARPIAIVKVTSPREVYLAGMKTIRDFNTTFIASWFILSLLLFYLLRILIIKRLSNISTEISKINSTKDFQLRVPQDGEDELHYVAVETNKMIESIEEYRKEKEVLLDQVNYELKLANIFSSKVQIIEAFLNNAINSMPSSIAITDNKINIIRLNSMAEKEVNLSSAYAKGHSLFDIFPFLIEHKQKFYAAPNTKNPTIIYKVIYNKKNETKFYNVVIYPLHQTGKNSLAVRIDDVSEETILENKINQNAKLVSIGVLAAGVAHEINNPINFVSAAIKPLKNNITDIVELLKKYESIPHHESPEMKLEKIKNLQNELDVKFSIEEITRLLDGIKDGASRTATIINNLKTFSRLDEDELKQADVHKIITSSLNLLSYKYQDRIKINEDFGHIPKITCYVGKLNQAIMSVLSNAIDAIPDTGEIFITTNVNTDFITISIRDTGHGIDEKNIKRIFDPFFTTKEVGKGRGLGLSIAYSIIREHHGNIQVKSKIDQGTEFILTLPIKQPG